MKRKFGIPLLSLIFLSIAYLLVLSPKVNILFASYKMKEVAPNIYVDQNMSQDDIKKIVKDLKNGKDIVNSYFDGLEASPTMLFIQSDEMIKKYGNPSGATYDTILGSYIIFGPRGFNTEIITHELVHCELRSRVHHKEIPTWFDEGLATFIDGRFQSEIDQWKKEQRKSEQVYDWTTQELFRYTKEPILERYKLAAYEVAQWFEKKEIDGLAPFITSLNDNDDDFTATYKSYVN